MLSQLVMSGTHNYVSHRRIYSDTASQHFEADNQGNKNVIRVCFGTEQFFGRFWVRGCSGIFPFSVFELKEIGPKT